MPRQTTSTANRSPSPFSSGPAASADWLLRVVDGGLAGVLLVAPWFMGGRHPLGQFVLVCFAMIVGVAWPLHQLLRRGGSGWRASGAEFILMAAVGLVVLQLAPLPSELLHWLSPHIGEILPLWSGDGSSGALGEWRTLTMTPEWTRGALVMLLAYGMIFLVTVQRIADLSDVERLLRWFSIAAVLMAVVGLLQYLGSNGKFLWIYQHTARTTDDAVKGPFINKNHFAHLLALSLGPLLWSVQKALQTAVHTKKDGFGNNDRLSKLSFWGSHGQLIVLALVLFAGLMTFSRGGIAVMGVAAVVCTALLYRASLLGKRFILALSATICMTVLALTIHGYTEVTERLDDYAGSMDELDSNEARRKIWEANWRGAQDYLAVGAGVGSHREVYPMYFPDPWGTEFTHAENGYLQVLLEAGVPGLTLLLIGICLCAYWCVVGILRSTSKRSLACMAAVTAGLAASVVHSSVDFVWYISSCMSFTVILAACACRLAQLTRSHDRKQPDKLWPLAQPTWLGLAVIMLIASGWMTHNRFCAAMAHSHWDQYLFSKRSLDPEAAGRGFDTPSIDQLRAVLHWTPNDARAHVRLAKLYLEGFENVQRTNPINDHPLSMIRQAALGNFASREETQRWLMKAVGPHVQCLDLARWHARRGLELCPLQGEAYVRLTNVDFLDTTPITEETCLAQAALVRPHHEEVLLALGSQAALRNDLPKAFAHWRELFKKNCGERRQLADMLASKQIPVEIVLEELQPNLSALRTVFRRYRAAKAQVDLTALLVKYRDAAESEGLASEGRYSAARWLEAHEAALALKDPMKAVEYGQRALQYDPNNFDAHFALGKCLLEQGRGADAETHLRWCSQRRPSDKTLRTALLEAVKGRVGGDVQMSSAPSGEQRRR